MVWWKLAIVFLLLVYGSSLTNGARKNPLKDPRKCGRPQCEPETNKFGYSDAKRYKYDYTMEIQTQFYGSGVNTSDLVLKAIVDLTFPKSCEGVLTLNSIQLRGQEKEEEVENEEVDFYSEVPFVEDENLHPRSVELSQDLEKHELRFAFHDGIIGEVCPHVEEPTWVLNFKKGILSALQNTMLRFDVDLNTTETDISGACNVAYTLQGAKDTSIFIQKVKDIQSCKERYQMNSFLQTTKYHFRDDKAIWPILNSRSYCNLSVDHHIYKEVTCYERHQLVIFSNNDAGAVTESRISLVLADEEPYRDNAVHEYDEDDVIRRRSSLLFDHTPTPKPTHGEIKASRDLLKQMCNLGFPNIKREFIDIFTKFLQTTRLLSYKALQQLLARSSSICNNGRNHVLESLPYISSPASVELMKDQLIAESIPIEMAQNWMASLSFLSRPEEGTLTTLYSLLEYAQKKTDPEYTLGATALVHTFCRHHPDCGSNEKIKQIVNLLEMEFLQLLEAKKWDRKNRERLVVVLKGLGNIGVTSKEFTRMLQINLISNNSVSTDLRLQACVTFRRSDCLKNRDFFLDIYSNYSQDPEVRMGSYIQAMRCPDYKSINLIRKVLENEVVNQVGSYVWSHLTNLAKSASPVRVEAQGLLLDQDLGDKFNLDIRKYSRNFEHSIFFDEYNFGTATDANIIFGPDSYLPRILTLNFTADLFGESVNFFEISARSEGFEQFVASVFGPKGPWNTESIRKKFGFLHRWLGEDNNVPEDDFINFDKLRLKRDITSKGKKPIQSSDDRRKEIQTDVDNLGYKLKYNYRQPKAALGLKVFGNDLKFYTMEGMLEVSEAVKKIDPYQQIARILYGNEVVYTKSGVLLDASYNVPLSSGLPLAIHAYGASSIDLRLAGHMNSKDPENIWIVDVEGKLKPSVSVDVLTSMETDFFYSSSGVRVKSNLYSSSSVEIKLKVRGMNLVSVTFSLPEEKNDIFSAKSELLVLKDSQEFPQAGISRRSENTTCTWPILDQAIGLKICSHYSVPDLTNDTLQKYPGLILSGPININMHLGKADPTAKNFVFDYAWNHTTDLTKGSFVFHTPDSAISRIFTSNFTKDPDTLNVSMSFLNGNNSYSAVGKYSANPDDRRLEIYVDTDGSKILAVEMKMNRTLAKNGFTYYPRALLSVRDDVIAGLAGTIRVTDKNGVLQNDINFTFETKQLQAKLVGYYVRTEVSHSTKLKMDYRFQDNKVESIELDGEFAKRSQKSKTELKSHLKLQTTAYPKYNFAANATWLSLLGHIEARLVYNNASDFVDKDHSTSVCLIFARSEMQNQKSDGYRTKVSFEIFRPNSNIDFRVLLKHEERYKNGPVHNMLGAIRYAPNKEATGVFSLFFPRRNLFAVDGSMNITVPTFDSCTVRLILIEKEVKDYSIDFNGQWFSGHSMSVKGSYQDKSSRIRTHHQLKLHAKSPSFEDTMLNCVYRKNELEIFTDVQAEYGKNPYGLTFKHSVKDDDQKSTYAEVKIREKVYWISSKLLSQKSKLLHMEIHIDKLRDIHLNIRGLSMESKKEASIEVKWDANRDPTQRLALLAEFNNPELKRYDGTLMVTYPDRTFSCGFDVHLATPNYNGLARVSWNTNEAVMITFIAGYSPIDLRNGWVSVEIKTPFEGWKKNGLQAGVHSENNLLLVNGSLLWADDQSIGLEFKGDYEINDPNFGCEVKFVVNSTIQDVPTMGAYFKHRQNEREIATDFDIRYRLTNESLQVYSMKSMWQLDKDDNYKNMTGTVFGRSPFEGYRTGKLAAKLALGTNKKIYGASTLSFEERKFTLTIEGQVKKITDSMLEVNVTTPIEKFKTITGRFGLNERKRHAVAMVSAPAGSLGAEVLFEVQHLANFDVKLSVATPIDAFQRLSLIGKMKPEAVDIRGGWNNITVGFTGIWRFIDKNDFEYSCRVYTPLENFEDNGIVFKYLYTKEIVCEVYGKLASYKLGMNARATPKSKLIQQLSAKSIQLELLENEEIVTSDSSDSSSSSSEEGDDMELDDIDYEDLINYIVEIEIDTVVWPTITGYGDIEETGDYFLVVGDLHLPQGKIDIKDRLFFPDMLNIDNMLKMRTPFSFAKEIKCRFRYSFKEKNHYTTGLEVAYSNPIGWNEIGYFVNYTITIDETEAKLHDVALTLKTPLKLLKRVDLSGFLELEELIYRANFTTKTNETYLSLGGSLESDDNFLETSVGIMLETAVIPHYGARVFFKKDFSEVENSIDMGFEIHDNVISNKLRVETMWYADQNHYLSAKGRIHTNILPLKLVESTVLLTKNPNPLVSLDISLLDIRGHRTEFRAMASRKKDFVNVEVVTPMAQFKNITLQGYLTRTTNADEYVLQGNLFRNSFAYAADGIVNFASGIPIQVKMRLRPKSGGPDGVIQYSLSSTEGDYGKTFQFSAIEEGKMCQVAGGYYMRSHLDWDISILVQSSEPELSRISINAKLIPREAGKLHGQVEINSPWSHLGIDNVKLGTNLTIKPDVGRIESSYELSVLKGHALCTWSWILLEDMQLAVETFVERTGSKPRIVQATAKYINPNKNFQKLSVGGKLNVDSLWALAANLTGRYISVNDFLVALHSKLPEPFGDVHHIDVRFRGVLPSDFTMDGQYESDEAKRKYAARVHFRYVSDLQGSCRMEWGRDPKNEAVEANIQMLPKGITRKEFSGKIVTPFHKDEDSLFVIGSFDGQDQNRSFVCAVNYPATRRVADINIKFKSFLNMGGHLNSTTPFLNVTWLRGDFDFETTGRESLRFLKATWPEDFTFFRLQSNFSSENLNRDLQGKINAEVPLATRHFAEIDYGLKERQQDTTGYANVNYNNKNVLKGEYKSKLESRVGYDKDVIDISLQNDLKPLGIHYIHLKQYVNAENPDYDMKHVELYELRNSRKFNITGELHVRSTGTGQNYKIVAIHPNRTVIVLSDYDYKDGVTKQKSKLQVSSTAWIGYNLELENKTKIENEHQSFLFELSYPKRNLSAEGWYTMTDKNLNSDIKFKWTNPDEFSTEEFKFVRTGLQWNSEQLQGIDKDNQTLVITIGHPSFKQDVKIDGFFYRSAIDLLKARIAANYSTDPEHLFEVHGTLRDLTNNLGFRNYTLDLFAIHEASELKLDVKGSAGAKPMLYKTECNAFYKRGYFPLKTGLFLILLDITNKQIDYLRQTPYEAVRFWVQPYGSYPMYGINGTVWDSPDVNSTGFFYIDLDRKYTRMEVNLTPDATQNIQMVGLIPDSRSGYFDLWRNYDEIRVIDIASYLRMNHSRLITGQFHWRPKLKDEIKDKIRSIGTSFYDSFSEGIDFWIKTMYSEVSESLTDVWENSKVHTKVFLDDVSGLSVLEEDLEDFRKFVNQSYEANDFYIKTVLNFTLTVLDELALRNHIESLPKILSEMWQVMGDSGKALRKSILWLIETIKSTYQDVLDTISKFFHGESFGHLSALLQRAVQKYDKIIKELHISFTKYVENLWNKFLVVASNYWKATLKRIEPHIFRFVHYIESALWNISQEVFDFIYKRTNELAESPYFGQVSEFTHDFDRLYKDIVSNDAVTNFKKYSVVAWDFIKEKYFKLVPFGKELDNVLSELWEAIKELQKVEQVQFVMQKIYEFKAKLEWLAEEIELEKRVHQLWSLVRNKISRATQNALQTDDMYREAKTKFIFDPDTGIINLEQKLPMSWHAFNETPKFEEIPEYKTITTMQNFFAGTNFSVLTYMYSMRSYLDYNTWLPPYKAHSLLIGSRHYMTFDRKFVGLNLRYENIVEGVNPEQCSYLLSQDFLNKNFTLLLEPSTVQKNGISISTRKLTFATPKHFLQIDVTGDHLQIGDDSTPVLPVQIDDVIVYRDSDVLIIESPQDFILNCNIQFDLCWFELSGWYFGQTAGILGTMNNEDFDDFKTSFGQISSNENDFINSWGLNSCNQKSTKIEDDYSSELIDICNEFFKTPYFSNCFEVLDPYPFYEMCLNMGANSISTVLLDNHPSQKGACTAALGYIEACGALKVPLRVPDKCVHCNTNGSFVPEGTFVELKDGDIPNTSDVVFIVEAKPCNWNVTITKNIMTVVNSIDKELEDANITNNRYAVIAFGGKAPFDKPRSIVHGNKVFTDVSSLKPYFDHIVTHNGTNNDIFEVISMAAKLVFRPGASKTFVLLPCSDCSAYHMKFDYSSLLQLMLEESINLHILMDQEFVFDKPRLSRVFFGMDRELAYSKRDLKEFRGDSELRKQVRLPKEGLGSCTPLAIETNGSVFTARKLRPEKRNPIKKFALIFAKRVAKTAMPNSCQTCECTGHNTGVAYMICTSCDTPSPLNLDYDFIENGADMNWDWEDDDEDLVDA